MVKLPNQCTYLHLSFLSTILGSGNGRNNENQGKSVRPSSSMSTLPEEEDLCSHCGSSSGKQKSRKWSCYSIIFLLAVDAFTIGLVLVLFSHHNYHLLNAQFFFGYSLLVLDRVEFNKEAYLGVLPIKILPPAFFAKMYAGDKVILYLKFLDNFRARISVTVLSHMFIDLRFKIFSISPCSMPIYISKECKCSQKHKVQFAFVEDGRLACGGMMRHATLRRSLSARTAPSFLPSTDGELKTSMLFMVFQGWAQSTNYLWIKSVERSRLHRMNF